MRRPVRRPVSRATTAPSSNTFIPLVCICSSLFGDLLARAGQPLTTESMELLEREHKSLTKNLGLIKRTGYSLATLGMFVALLTLCGVYVLAYERRIIDNMRHFLTVLGLLIVTVGLTMLAGTDSLRAELIPLLLFGMTISIACS